MKYVVLGLLLSLSACVNKSPGAHFVAFGVNNLEVSRMLSFRYMETCLEFAQKLQNKFDDNQYICKEELD